ncbi:hypothetical protein F4776DRAFT_220569 [Hypoxylon sp. NC0597]|nr:hypothetical protein F4776DRAFT_220569 [Hypoxylon sp. NC0597]
MSHYRWRLSGYEDERRWPYEYNSGRYESYKPSDNRSPPRSHSRDADQNRDMESGRRDSKEARDTRPPPRSPRGNKRDVEPPKNLQIDTRVADGSRRTSLSSHASVSALTAPPTEPAADRIAKLNSQPSSIATPTVPKAKDPKVQDIFEAIYKWNETLQERMLLKLRKGQLLREEQRRQNEVAKIANKVDDYAPYSEFQRRFEESGKAESENLSKHLAGLDRQYLDDLEKVVTTVSSHSSIGTQAEAQSESLVALETKFAEFQKQNSEQQKQISEAQAHIQDLLSDREKTTKALSALDKDFKDLKSGYCTLQAENSELKQQVASLESSKSSKDDLDQVSRDFQALMAKVNDVEKKVNTLVEDFDMKTYNEILDTWIGHDFKNIVISNQTAIAALSQDLQSFQESTSSQFESSNALVQETRKTLEALKSPQPAPQENNTQLPKGVEHSQQALQALVEERINAFNEVIQKTVADSGDVCAEMVDEVRDRIDKIEAIINHLRTQIDASLKSLSKETDVATRVGFLEKFATKHGTDFQLLGKRVESLEGQRLGPRIDSVGVDLTALEKKVQNYQEKGVGGDAARLETYVNSIKSEIDHARKDFESLELTVRTLDSQWANLNTKQMAEKILQHMDTYGQRNEARFAAVEHDLNYLKTKTSSIEESLISLLKESRKFAGFAKTPPQDGKRQASPGLPAEEPTKKRKLDSNGQPQVAGLRSSSLNL